MKVKDTIKLLQEELSSLQEEEVLIVQRLNAITRRRRILKVALEKLGASAQHTKKRQVALTASQKSSLRASLTPLK